MENIYKVGDKVVIEDDYEETVFTITHVDTTSNVVWVGQFPLCCSDIIKYIPKSVSDLTKKEK